MKLTIIILGLLALGVLSCCAKSYIEGEARADDKVFFDETYKAKGKWLKRKFRTVTYPPKGQEGGPIIHLLNVTDTKRPDSKKGGTVAVESGGVGFSYVVLTITSAKSKGYNFHVQLVGQ